MSSRYETFDASELFNDFEAMESSAYADAQAEERYRDAEINFGLDASGGAPEPYWSGNNTLPAKPQCRCALCVDPRDLELPAARPPARETRIAAAAEVA